MSTDYRTIELGIYEALRAAAATYPAGAVDVTTHPSVTFQFGNFKITCRPTEEAIMLVANKFKRGSDNLRGKGGKPWTAKAEYASLRTIGPYDWRET